MQRRGTDGASDGPPQLLARGGPQNADDRSHEKLYNYLLKRINEEETLNNNKRGGKKGGRDI